MSTHYFLNNILNKSSKSCTVLWKPILAVLRISLFRKLKTPVSGNPLLLSLFFFNLFIKLLNSLSSDLSIYIYQRQIFDFEFLSFAGGIS